MGYVDWTIKAPAKVDNYIDMYRYRVFFCVFFKTPLCAFSQVLRAII